MAKGLYVISSKSSFYIRDFKKMSYHPTIFLHPVHNHVQCSDLKRKKKQTKTVIGSKMNKSIDTIGQKWLIMTICKAELCYLCHQYLRIAWI